MILPIDYPGKTPSPLLTEFTLPSRVYRDFLTSHPKTWEVIWKVAAATSAVALIAFTVISTVYCGIQAPIYVPLLIAVIFSSGLPLTRKIMNYCMGKGLFYTNQAHFKQQLDIRMKQQPKTQEGLNKRLKNLTGQDCIPAPTDDPNSKVYPGFFQSLIELLIERSNQNLKKAQGMRTEDLSKEKRTLKGINQLSPASLEKYTKSLAKQMVPLVLEEEAALSRIQAAYHLYMLTYSSNPSPNAVSLPKLFSLNPALRNQSKGLEDPFWEIVAQKGDRIFTISEIAKKSLFEIMNELFIENPTIPEKQLISSAKA